MSNRKEYRQHSKSALLLATETLFRERHQIVAMEGRKWRRRLALAAASWFAIGVVAGRLL